MMVAASQRITSAPGALVAIVKKWLSLLSVITLCLIGPLPAKATTGADWTSRSAATNKLWLSVTYGKGLFVAVGATGNGNRVMTSPDGITWTTRTSAEDNRWTSVAYGNGLFVAVASSGSGNRVMTSPDGITWTIRSSAEDNKWASVTYGNGLFVAVAFSGDGNRVMTSPDGIAWTIRTTPADNSWGSVTYGNNLFVAVASTGASDRVMTSQDGITWTIGTSAGGANYDWRSVTYGNGLFVAVASSGSGNRVMTSPDGITWTSRSSAADNQWYSVAYGNGLFVAVAISGNGNRVMTSSDGISWTSRTSAEDNQWNGVAYGSGWFVAIAGSGTNRVMTSGSACGDGLNYTTGNWVQFALPCFPTASPSSIAKILGNSPTANLDAGTYNAQWALYRRDAPNNSNIFMSISELLTIPNGYWFKSLTAPIGNKITVAGTTTTPVLLDGCQSLVGCVVIPVATTLEGPKMLGNPFAYDIEWSNVRIEVNGTVYTPSDADANGYVSNQIWIWNGSSYDTWDDFVTPGNLKYSQSYFIKVLPGGVGKTINLLVPVNSSSIQTSIPSRILHRLADLSRSIADAIADTIAPRAAAQTAVPGWRVKLRVETPEKVIRARATLGQFTGSVTGYDRADLITMAPFAAPWLTLVFPHTDWGAKSGDYATDYRAFDKKPGSWLMEMRTDQAGPNVLLRWEGDPAILRQSRLIDKLTGRVINPADPAYANGYPVTLNPAIRQFEWEFLGP